MKNEQIYREILYNVFELKKNFLTQSYISKKCNISIGNVNYSLKALEQINAIEKKARGFRVINPKKIMLYWASKRKLKPLYETHTDLIIAEIEKAMPQGVIFTAYSAYKFLFKSVPADYGEVFVYANIKEAEEIKMRFPEREGKPNIFVLEKDANLAVFKQVSLAQLYVDLWNINTWYSQDFLNALSQKIDNMLKE